MAPGAPASCCPSGGERVDGLSVPCPVTAGRGARYSDQDPVGGAATRSDTVNHRMVLQTMITLASAALGLVVALAWNEAIKVTIAELLGEADDLSFGASESYGALHPLSGVVNILRRKHGVDLLPLFTFGDAVPEDDEDRRELEHLWQDAERLAACCAAVVAGIGESARLQELAADFPELIPRLTDLERSATWAAQRGAKVRITYRLQ